MHPSEQNFFLRNKSLTIFMCKAQVYIEHTNRYISIICGIKISYGLIGKKTNVYKGFIVDDNEKRRLRNADLKEG